LNKNWRPLIKSTKRTGLDEQEKKCLKIEKGPGWNQGGKWLEVSQISVGTLVHESLPRRQQEFVSRVRMGNTNMTLSYPFKSNPPPFCEECSTTVTIDHILWNCSVFIEVCSFLEKNWCIRAYLKNRGVKNRRRMEGIIFIFVILYDFFFILDVT
jgi:hypothetical protein